MKYNLSEKVHEKMIFFVYSVEIVFLFPTYFTLDDLLQKKTLKDEIFGIIEKYDIHPRKYGILLIEKLKMIKKFTFKKTFH